MYLAGPISGLDYKGATDWREAVSRELLPEIIGVSPMRGKEYLADYGQLGARPDEKYMVHAMSTPKAITNRDRWDTTTCDAVLMNLLGAQKVSIGTMIEAGWADIARTPVVLVMEDENIHNHAMLTQIAAFIVPTLEDGVDILRTMFYRGRGA